jgi:hypothetical protein
MMTQELHLPGFLPAAGRPRLAGEAVRRAVASGQVSPAAGPRRLTLTFATPGVKFHADARAVAVLLQALAANGLIRSAAPEDVECEVRLRRGAKASVIELTGLEPADTATGSAVAEAPCGG